MRSVRQPLTCRCCVRVLRRAQWKFSLYFMGTVPAGITLPEDPASEEAVALLWKWPGVLLELTQYAAMLRTSPTH